MIKNENLGFCLKFFFVGGLLAASIYFGILSSVNTSYPPINIPAGYVLEIDKKPSSVFGNQECNNNLGILYPSINSTSTKDCITILPNTTKVIAYIIINREVVEESWTVEQKNNNGIRIITIKRPNGDILRPFQFNKPIS
jgi:hypothetical protein